MIEATCSACGTLNRVPEATVPIGAKFVTCADCKSRVPIPAPAAAAPPGRLPPPIPKPPAAAAKPADIFDLADLPAPKRASPLGAEPSKPAPRSPLPGKPTATRSGLSAALDPDLPAPKARSALAPAAPPTLDLDDPRGTPPDAGVDLLAPKKPSSRAAPEPARDESFDDVMDLPAPKPDPVADLPAPKRNPRRIPEPVRDTIMKAPSPAADLPGHKRGPNIPDVPTPRAADPQPRSAGIADLPAPKGFFDDLPQVKSNPSGGVDLPAPKGYFDNIPALPNPNRPELPAPKGYFDNAGAPSADKPELPAPKGFFDDLPQPALHQRPELPAPKGFFDNIPQVKSNPTSGPEVPAPKGYFENIPGLPNTSKPELPAPKGFFENIPGLPNTSKPELPAPKGFFDDIPGLPNQARPEVPAPKGHFENVPGRPNRKSNELAPKGFFDDLPQPARATSDNLVLDGGPELELTAPAAAGTTSFDDLDLSKPSIAPVRFEPPARAPAAHPSISPPGGRYDGGPSLELEGVRADVDAPRPIAKRPPKPAPTVDPAAAVARARRSKLMLGGLVAAVVLGGGGYWFYRRHAAAEARAEAILEQLQVARSSYAASDPAHWQRAAAAARKVIELDDNNPEALGIASESLIASAISDGTAAPGKLAQARALLDTANGAGITSPQLTRARALALIAAHQADGALAQLEPLATRAPKDGNLALYVGWARDAKGDPAAAITAFDIAAADPAAKLLALYGRGNARRELADLEGARGDFAAVLQLARDHIGAQVGLAAAQPPSAAQQQEADLLAILARKDIPSADPRVVAQAWTLAGIAAERAGRHAVARERFRKALGVAPQDLAATTGLAETELADGKVIAAAELIATALSLAKDNVPAQLVQCEIEIAQSRLPLAAQRLAALASHPTPLTPLDQARLYFVTGKLLEAQGKDDDAIEAYTSGAKVAGDLDLTPLMAAVGKLTAMTAAAVNHKDAQRATDLRARSELLLGELGAHAEQDPRLAMTLGMAYLQQGDPAKAERWLRGVVQARPGDAEAHYQLGRALLKAGKHDDALAALNAALTRDPTRSDIGVDLARTYEALGRDPEAGALYSRLLAGKEPSLELRARAGRYFARTGAIAKAGEQGARIVEVDPHNAAGLYLKGEGLLAGGKALEAKQTFQEAIAIDRDPVYLDALGRAAETLAQGGDRELQDLALRSYLAASDAAPESFNALAGQGRLFVARHEAAKALVPLLAAARLDPRNADVMYLTGAAYQELAQAQLALQWLEASTKIGPRAEAYWRIGQIYRDINQGPKAADALANATRMATASEKHPGKPVAWLTDALYLQGRVNFDLHSDARAREAWQQYVARNPPASARLTEVQQLLATTLR